MKNIFMLLILLSVTLMAQTNFSPYETDILAVNKEGVIIKNNPDIEIGTTGVIVHFFDAVHRTIIANVEVIKKGTDKLLLKVSPFDAIAQEALPDYNIPPKVGDKVILNFLYNRALAIVPDEETYHTVTRSYDVFTWLHPDLFAVSLAKSYTPTPDKERFQKECIAQNIGLLFFAIKQKGYFVDCRSFKTLNTIPLPEAKSVKIPFYNRLDSIKGRLFGLFGGKGINDYNSYYAHLIKVK